MRACRQAPASGGKGRKERSFSSYGRGGGKRFFAEEEEKNRGLSAYGMTWAGLTFSRKKRGTLFRPGRNKKKEKGICWASRKKGKEYGGGVADANGSSLWERKNLG